MRNKLARSFYQEEESPSTPQSAAKQRRIKMKLFEQPLEKLFSPKAMKQLNHIISDALPSNTAPNLMLQHLNEFPSTANTTTNSLALNRRARRLSSVDGNNNSPSSAQREQLLLSVIPEPIKNILNELYLRAPSTVGIFRKSPNAKHCKELRQKLETDSHSSIGDFQVAVIASVFKVSFTALSTSLLLFTMRWSLIFHHKLCTHSADRLSGST